MSVLFAVSEDNTIELDVDTTDLLVDAIVESIIPTELSDLNEEITDAEIDSIIDESGFELDDNKRSLLGLAQVVSLLPRRPVLLTKELALNIADAVDIASNLEIFDVEERQKLTDLIAQFEELAEYDGEENTIDESDAIA